MIHIYEIKRGTTPVIKCEFPFDTTDLVEAILTIRQLGCVTVEKYIGDANRDGTTLSYTLSQEDTLKLDHKYPIEIQVRAKTTYGSALASLISEIEVGEVLKDGVI